jgi:hypothetical protein
MSATPGSTDHSEEELNTWAKQGEQMAAVALSSWKVCGVVSSYAAFNALGNMVEAVFVNVPWEEPPHMIEEFDHWVKYTRERLAETGKARLS